MNNSNNSDKKKSEPGCVAGIIFFGILFVLFALAGGLGSYLGGGEFYNGFTQELDGYAGLIVVAAILIILFAIIRFIVKKR